MVGARCKGGGWSVGVRVVGEAGGGGCECDGCEGGVSGVYVVCVRRGGVGGGLEGGRHSQGQALGTAAAWEEAEARSARTARREAVSEGVRGRPEGARMELREEARA